MSIFQKLFRLKVTKRWIVLLFLMFIIIHILIIFDSGQLNEHEYNSNRVRSSNRNPKHSAVEIIKSKLNSTHSTVDGHKTKNYSLHFLKPTPELKTKWTYFHGMSKGIKEQNSIQHKSINTSNKNNGSSISKGAKDFKWEMKTGFIWTNAAGLKNKILASENNSGSINETYTKRTKQDKPTIYRNEDANGDRDKKLKIDFSKCLHT